MIETRTRTEATQPCYLEVNGDVLICTHFPCLWCGGLVHCGEQDDDVAAVNAHRECLVARLDALDSPNVV